MSPGHLLYRCDLCRHAVRGPDVPDVRHWLAFLAESRRIPAVVPDRAEPFVLHDCPDGRVGIARLVGGVVDDPIGPGGG